MNLRTKILGAMALVLAVTVGASFLVLIRYQRAQLLRNTAEATSHLADTIRATLEHAMLANDPAEVQRIVRAVGRQPGIEGVFVLDATGVARVASAPDRIGGRLADGQDGLSPEAPGSGRTEKTVTAVLQRQPSPILRSTSLIGNAPQCGGCHSPGQPILGALVVDRSLVEMERQLRASLAYMLGSAGLAFLVLTGTIYAVLHRLLVLPLAELGRAARAIEAGRYETPLTLERPDEVGELARALDRMRCRILEHLDQVRRWGEELEVRVAERTQELRTLNRVALVTNEALDLAAIFTRALETVQEALAVGAGAIVLATPRLQGSVVAQRGLSQAETDALTRQTGQSGVELACAGSVTEVGVRAFACFPIRSKGALIGRLCIHNPGDRPLTPEKLRLLEALAAQLGGTAERAVLHQDLDRSFRELQASQAVILERERRIASLEAVRAATVTLSHHINNATAGIAGCRNVLASTLGDQGDWQARYALDGIQGSVQKITAVLQALRDLTRIELTRFPGGLEAIDVDRAIQEKLAELDPDQPRPSEGFPRPQV